MAEMIQYAVFRYLRHQRISVLVLFSSFLVFKTQLELIVSSSLFLICGLLDLLG